MGPVLRKNDAHYTYGDYRTWSEDEWWELINGTAWNMSPTPNRAHQEILGRLYLLFGMWLRDKPCQVYLAPFDVLFPAEPQQTNDEVGFRGPTGSERLLRPQPPHGRRCSRRS
jgi:hypothetical protein